MDFEQWATGHSPFHRASPKFKIAAVVCFSFALASCTRFPAAATGLGLGVLAVLVARISPISLLKRLAVVNIFVLLCWLTLPLTMEGTTVATFGFLTVSREGLDFALLITLKTNGLILFFIALLSTSSIADLGQGLRSLHCPQKLCLLLLFSYRYIFVIYDEYRRLRRAAIFRSFRPSSSLHTYQTYGNLFGMTLVKGWQRAGRVQDAMLLRGFCGEFRSLNYRATCGWDWIILVWVVGCSFVVLYFEYG